MKRLLFLILLILSTIGNQTTSVQADLKDDLSSVIVYPNPVRVSKGHTKVTFDNLTNNAMVKIVKISGEVIREINATDTNGKVIWDLTNDSQQPVASAVYLYLITNENNQKTKGKLVIIR